MSLKKAFNCNAIKYEKEIRGIELERKKKMSFTDKMIAYVENISKFIDNLLKEMSLKRGWIRQCSYKQPTTF